MKRYYVLLTFVLSLVFNGCTGVKSTVSGLDNESFLSFYSSNNYISDVEVQLGNNSPFLAEVNKMRRNSTNFEKRPKTSRNQILDLLAHTGASRVSQKSNA